jgi:hypothetical protein
MKNKLQNITKQKGKRYLRKFVHPRKPTATPPTHPIDTIKADPTSETPS